MQLKNLKAPGPSFAQTLSKALGMALALLFTWLYVLVILSKVKDLYLNQLRL